MSRDHLSECERDNNGDIVDPIYFNVIPTDRVIIVYEGDHKWCMDVRALLENALINNSRLNPLTRNELSSEAVSEISEYRLNHLRVVTTLDGDRGMLDKNGVVTFSIDDIYLVGDLYVKCVIALGGVITRMRVVYGDKYLDEMDFDLPIVDFTDDKEIRLLAYTYDMIGDDYDKVKEFVSKYDRYGTQSSPFPEEDYEDYEDDGGEGDEEGDNEDDNEGDDSSLFQTAMTSNYDNFTWYPVAQDDVDSNSNPLYTWDLIGANGVVNVPSSYEGDGIDEILQAKIREYNDSLATPTPIQHINSIGDTAALVVSMSMRLPDPSNHI